MINFFLAILAIAAWVGIITHVMHLQAVHRERAEKPPIVNIKEKPNKGV